MTSPDLERPDLWHCAACTTAYAVGLEACPHCGSTGRLGEAASPPAAAPAMAKQKEVAASGADHD